MLPKSSSSTFFATPAMTSHEFTDNEPQSPHNVVHPLNPEEFRRQGHMVVDFIADYYNNIEHYPVLSQVKPATSAISSLTRLLSPPNQSKKSSKTLKPT
ncbi:unnamed protein product [Linum trigynum]|uniref:Uncharacterized protein n=1 Tax=Linum trigynum TaxID=586398 RepID=A0AAV2G2W7_9ROSI